MSLGHSLPLSPSLRLRFACLAAPAHPHHARRRVPGGAAHALGGSVGGLAAGSGERTAWLEPRVGALAQLWRDDTHNVPKRPGISVTF